MKFKGTGIVWDAARDRMLCDFGKAGSFEATDEETVQKLIGLGYESDAPAYVDVDIIEEPVKDVDIVDEPVEVKKPAAKRPYKKAVSK